LVEPTQTSCFLARSRNLKSTLQDYLCHEKKMYMYKYTIKSKRRWIRKKSQWNVAELPSPQISRIRCALLPYF
jgi:hypothetical protein